MDKATLAAMASEEARRLLEKEFSFHNPYTVVTEDVPYTEIEKFYSLVDEELCMSGEEITRYGQFFKINKYQKK